MNNIADIELTAKNLYVVSRTAFYILAFYYPALIGTILIRCQMAPGGGYVPRQGNSSSQLAPNGNYIQGDRGMALCPDGSYVAGSRCVLTPSGGYIGR